MNNVLTNSTNTGLGFNKANTTAGSSTLVATDDLIAKRRCFASYTFYLDNLDGQSQKRIERGIKLLGASVEAFFSNQCTHIITNKPIPEYDNFLNIPNCPDTERYKTAPREAMIEKAIEWGKTLWSTEVMLKTVELLLHSQRGKAPQHAVQSHQKRKLDAMLKEEKLHGSHTGQKQQNICKKLKFKPFTGHYIIVEDIKQIYRPPVIKVYTEELITKKQLEYPWPYMKKTAPHKSPFAKRAPSTASTAASTRQQAKNQNMSNKENDGDEDMPLAPQEVQQQQQHIPQAPVASTDIVALEPSQSQQPKPAIVHTEDSQQFESNQTGTIYNHTYNMSNPTTTTTSTPRTIEINQTLPPAPSTNDSSTIQINKNKLKTAFKNPPASVQMLAKRMIEVPKAAASTAANKTQQAKTVTAAAPAHSIKENLVNGIPQKHRAQTQPTQQQQKAQKQPEQKKKDDAKKKKDYKFCENCNMLFENYEEHIKQKKHMDFVNDERTWAELDALIATTARPLKKNNN